MCDQTRIDRSVPQKQSGFPPIYVLLTTVIPIYYEVKNNITVDFEYQNATRLVKL